MSSFKHDCNKCIFIGTFLDKEVDDFVDYWYHKNDDWVTLIRRFSDEPSDYGAMLLMNQNENNLPESYKQIYESYMHWVVYNKEEDNFV